MTQLRRATRVHVAGHRGLVGSALVRALDAHGCETILTAGRDELDLRDQSAVDSWYADNKPECVFLAAGTVGGIHANSTRPAEFVFDNLMIHANVIHAAYEHRVDKLLALGSSCIYPRETPQPMREESLLAGPLEPTNRPYAVAKIAGIELCRSYRRQYGCRFISAMPTNLYGPNDNFDLDSSHVIPALLRKFHEAKQDGSRTVKIWGTGTPLREFMHVDDLADACVLLMQHYDGNEHVNVGSGEELTVGDLALLIRDVVGADVRLEFDPTRPDGAPRKLLDSSVLRDLGWRHSIELREGIASTYEWFRQHVVASDTPASAAVGAVGDDA